MHQADVIVIGGGLVGAAIAYGLLRRGRSTVVFDGGDRDHRAVRANGGLIWTQNKGIDMPPYRRWTHKSARLWPAFAKELNDLTDWDIHFRQDGGLTFLLGAEEYEDRIRVLEPVRDQSEGDFAVEMMERPRLESLLPGVPLGPDVSGASYCARDGYVNPLRFLKALHTAIPLLGGKIIAGQPVKTIKPGNGEFLVERSGTTYAAGKLVIAAGVGTPPLAAQIDLDLPIRPQRGQALVTERLPRLLKLAALNLNQTREGTFTIGATKEEVGFDDSVTTLAAATLARKAVRILPALAQAKVVRHWAGLRVMSPDGFPIYVQSETYPGAFAAACHSGLTLAAVHAHTLASAIIAGALPGDMAPFHPRRFHVQEAA